MHAIQHLSYVLAMVLMTVPVCDGARFVLLTSVGREVRHVCRV